jgi:RNA polymerase sigma-70 factor, ECF subfamily
MTADDDLRALLPAIAENGQRFLELVQEIRPELHRYCARMTGSIFDGEDVVQDTLAKAHYALAQMTEPPPLRPWLFRIAHNTAMDFLRRYERTHVDVVAEVPDFAEPDGASVDPELFEAALTVFAELPPVQRSALVLKDVLGHSLEETAATMGTSVLAVKAALVRARANVRKATASREPPTAAPAADVMVRLRRYADLFNARNWDGLRSLVGEESRLDLVSRAQRRGAGVAEYYSRYEVVSDAEGLTAEPGWVDGVAALGVFRGGEPGSPAYYVLVEWEGPRIALIRDFRYVPYIARGSHFTRG